MSKESVYTARCKYCGKEIGFGGEFCPQCSKEIYELTEKKGLQNPKVQLIMSIVLIPLLSYPCYVVFRYVDAVESKIFSIFFGIAPFLGILGSFINKNNINKRKQEIIKQIETENEEREALENLRSRIEQFPSIDVDSIDFSIPSTLPDGSEAFCPNCNRAINSSKIICPQCRPKLAELAQAAKSIGNQVVYCEKCNRYFVDLTQCPICENEVSVCKNMVDDLSDAVLLKTANQNIQEMEAAGREALESANEEIALFPVKFQEIYDNWKEYTDEKHTSARLSAEFQRHKTVQTQQALLQSLHKQEELLKERVEFLSKQHTLENALESLAPIVSSLSKTAEETRKKVLATYVSGLERMRSEVPESMRIYRHIMDHQDEIIKYKQQADEIQRRMEEFLNN